jgi:hypothetical protein
MKLAKIQHDAAINAQAEKEFDEKIRKIYQNHQAEKKSRITLNSGPTIPLMEGANVKSSADTAIIDKA